MSSEALSRLIARANADGAFRHELVGDPQGVGAANGLSIEEVDALMSGDSARLRQVGVSEELSHFTLIHLPLPPTAGHGFNGPNHLDLTSWQMSMSRSTDPSSNGTSEGKTPSVGEIHVG